TAAPSAPSPSPDTAAGSSWSSRRPSPCRERRRPRGRRPRGSRNDTLAPSRQPLSFRAKGRFVRANPGPGFSSLGASREKTRGARTHGVISYRRRLDDVAGRDPLARRGGASRLLESGPADPGRSVGGWLLRELASPESRGQRAASRPAADGSGAASGA